MPWELIYSTRLLVQYAFVLKKYVMRCLYFK